jgi:hypothetical protein
MICSSTSVISNPSLRSRTTLESRPRCGSSIPPVVDEHRLELAHRDRDRPAGRRAVLDESEGGRAERATRYC